jgi:hypothetical protein
MKLYLICGPDRLGKDSIIKQLSDFYNYDNISIRHFAKPKKGYSPEITLYNQFNSFTKEIEILDILKQTEEYSYYENIVIYNRSYLGEYVYSQMFREISSKKISKKIINFENNYILEYNPKLIMLTATPEFCLAKEDGNSFSQTLEQKKKELELFDEVFELTQIKDKIKIKVDNFGRFIPKEDIKKELINFIK